jgi:hypothetical protein
MAVTIKKMMLLGAMVFCLALVLYAMPEQQMQDSEVIAHVDGKVS